MYTMQARIVALNASFFLKPGSHYMVSIKVSNKTSTTDSNQVTFSFSFLVHCLFKFFFFSFFQANCIDTTMPAETVFANEVKKLQADELKPAEQLTLEPYERDHACVVGGYRIPKKQKAATAA